MKAYLSGPITGMPNRNKEGFAKAEEKVKSHPLFSSVVNPLDVDPIVKNPQWIDYMRSDIKELMYCDCIVMIPGWESSRGAKVELSLAMGLGLKVYHIESDTLFEVDDN